jgi:hypothetical protein
MTITTRRTFRRRLIAGCICAVMFGGALAGCGDDASDETPSTTSSSDVGTKSNPIEVTIEGDTVTPNGERVKATVGKPVSIHVTSDRAGELHVHSTPEQELEYDKGETDLSLTVETPGVIDVEDHVAEVVILQLQVS